MFPIVCSLLPPPGRAPLKLLPQHSGLKMRTDSLVAKSSARTWCKIIFKKVGRQELVQVFRLFIQTSDGGSIVRTLN
jgi:hypothetical protein